MIALRVFAKLRGNPGWTVVIVAPMARSAVAPVEFFSWMLVPDVDARCCRPCRSPAPFIHEIIRISTTY